MKRLVIASLLLAGCGESGPPSYIKFAGGGIQFNYGISEASMVVIAQQTQPLPEGSTVEALFELPGTNTRESVTMPAMQGKLTYHLQSQPLFNITKGGQYRVTIRLIDKFGKELDHQDRIYTSDEDQSTLPSKPLVKDNAFTPNN